MVERKSIHIAGFKHANPIPNASRVGNIVMSGVIMGRRPPDNKFAETIEEQCALVFQYMKDTVETAGGTTDNIVKVNVWLKDPSSRDALNAEWTKMFPDPEARPARHTNKDVSDSPALIQIDFTAVLG